MKLLFVYSERSKEFQYEVRRFSR